MDAAPSATSSAVTKTASASSSRFTGGRSGLGSLLPAVGLGALVAGFGRRLAFGPGGLRGPVALASLVALGVLLDLGVGGLGGGLVLGGRLDGRGDGRRRDDL